MEAARHPLFRVKAMLEDCAREADRRRLAECLSGMHLPALGGNEHPADILHRALSLPPYDPNLAEQIAVLTAGLCERRAHDLNQALEAGIAPRPVPDEPYVFNLCLLASYLPREPALFDGLKILYRLSRRADISLSSSERVGRQLRQALIYQQADDSLEPHWLDLIEQIAVRAGRLNELHKTDLLAAWTGLLWIPPSPADRKTGKTLAISRVEKGLFALHAAVAGTPDALPILRYAIHRLSEAYPRSPEFWQDQLSPRLASWPQALREIAAKQWPLLSYSPAGSDERPRASEDPWPYPRIEETEVAEPRGEYAARRDAPDEAEEHDSNDRRERSDHRRD